MNDYQIYKEVLWQQLKPFMEELRHSEMVVGELVGPRIDRINPLLIIEDKLDDT